MKYLRFQTLNTLLFFALLVLSCGKDDNGQNSDPLCSNVECNNGAPCVSGICDCPPRYEGPTCDIPVTPIAVELVQVIVKNFPTTDAFGSGWDEDFGKADISFRILSDSDVIYEHSNFVENANPDDDHMFTVTGFSFTDVKQELQIQLLDNDGSEPADIIDSYLFVVYSESTGFPGLLELRGGSSQFDLILNYIH
jgi:hypothetical protein